MPKVSVIIPCYNTEKYLETCLQTLLAQTLEDLEFIFVDDGSTKDNTAAVLDSFIDRDPRVVVIHQENKCLGGARNTGIKAATGEYIGFLDADDTLSPNYYEVLYDAAKRHDADIAWTSIFRTRSDGSGHWRMQITRERVFENKAELFEKVYNVVVTRIYRRTMFDDPSLLFREHWYYEDMIFSLPILYAANKVVQVPGATYYYLYVEDSIVRRRQSSQMQRNRYEATLFQRQFLLSKGIKVPKSLRSIRRWEWGFNNFPILKLKDYGKYNLLKLFDLIPIWITTNNIDSLQLNKK